MLGSRSATIGSPDGLRRGRERGQPGGDPGRQTASRAGPRSSVTATDSSRDREQRADTGSAGIDRPGSAAEAGEPAGPERRRPVVHARRRRALAWLATGGPLGRDGIAGQDDAARVVDHDDEAAVQASTRPIALSASSGSISGRSSSAAPRSTIRPIAVPSSSVKPSGRRSTTRPPTRTSRPMNGARSSRSASVPRGRGVGRAARGRGAGRLPQPPLVVGASRCLRPGWPATRTSAGKRGVTAKRWSDAVGCGPPCDPDDRRGPALDQRRARDPGTRLADDHDRGPCRRRSRRASGRRAC